MVSVVYLLWLFLQSSNPSISIISFYCSSLGCSCSSSMSLSFGAQIIAVLVLSYFPLLRMWSIYFPLISLMLSSILVISVLLLNSLLFMVFDHYTFTILLRYLFWKVSHLCMSKDVIFQHSDLCRRRGFLHRY